MLLVLGPRSEIVDLDGRGSLGLGREPASYSMGTRKTTITDTWGWEVTGECLVCPSLVSPSQDSSFFIPFSLATCPSFSEVQKSGHDSAFLKKATELPATWVRAGAHHGVL